MRWRGVLFRLAFTYWGLFCLPFLPYEIPGFRWLGKLYGEASDAIVVWVGREILHIPYTFGTQENGSGDRTADWVYLFCLASLALVATAVWSALDRRRAHDDRLRVYLRVLVRYVLAFTLLSYGVSKLFLGQFPPPNSGRLLQRFGDASPMGLMWTFMGASPAYVFFSGAAESLGALLLLFRRTTTLGALILGAVLTNIVMMNFCYDVPVKINSAHYLAMCIFLILPDARRLADVLVLNRAAPPAAPDLAPPARRWVRIAGRAVKYVVILAVLFDVVRGDVERSAARNADDGVWYAGNWLVTRFTRDGKEEPALESNAARWKRIRFQVTPARGYARWRYMDESASDLYGVVVDEAARTMAFKLESPDGDSRVPRATDRPTLRYQRVDADHFTLEGQLGSEVVVALERMKTDRMLLVTRGFHWINEAPFNR